MNRRSFHKLAGFGLLDAWTKGSKLPALPTPNPAQADPISGSGFREPDPIDFADHTGFVPMFDGKTLENWDGNPDVWRVENGAIVGTSTREKPSGNTFIVYRGTEAKDFDLKLEIKVENGGGSGVQYRSSTGMPPPGGTGGRGGPGPTACATAESKVDTQGTAGGLLVSHQSHRQQLYRSALLAEYREWNYCMAWTGGEYAARQNASTGSKHR